MQIEFTDGTIIITTNEAQFESDDVESVLFHLEQIILVMHYGNGKAES